MAVLLDIKELYDRRDLLWVWSLREIKARYKQTLFGFAWAVFQPMALSLLYVIVFSYVVRVPSEGIPYPIFVYSAILPWSFFARAIGAGTSSVVANMNLVKKVYFPRVIFPLAAIATSLVDFLCGLAVFIAMMICYRVPISPAMGILPALFMIQLLLTTGVALGGAAINVAYRDINQMVPLLLQLWMYACPIIYPLSLVPDWLRPWYTLNPMAVVIDGYRQVILKGQIPPLGAIGVAAAIALVAFLIGYLTFKYMEAQFADII